ncbi:hypothetical protein LPU83_pLPU83b_0083 (plasmid) [Rhizobium favelukesii]|uniref:Uncharacterized protein n=1 Tax=Rhizobium favelukesii TaxID=348824 RepID=W6RFR5_9HYPH|nr:hypothetical protein LPU83_pLPU83b_0083 [Rhizobium favelukesii]
MPQADWAWISTRRATDCSRCAAPTRPSAGDHLLTEAVSQAMAPHLPGRTAGGGAFRREGRRVRNLVEDVRPAADGRRHRQLP